MINLAKLVGPILAGASIAIVGEGVCFIFNAIDFLAVLAPLFMMRAPRRNPPPRSGLPFRQNAEVSAITGRSRGMV